MASIYDKYFLKINKHITINIVSDSKITDTKYEKFTNKHITNYT